MSNLYRYGKLRPDQQVQRRDESGVASAELVALIRSLGPVPGVRALSLMSGVPERSISCIFGTPTLLPSSAWTSLMVTDRLLTAFGAEHRIHELTIIPNINFADALAMARYEFINSDGDTEILTGTKEQHNARAHELVALREALIGDELRRLASSREAHAKYRRERKKLLREAAAA